MAAIRAVRGALLALAAVAPDVMASTYTVDDDRPADFASIQAAINAASNGDEIVVRPGRYRETLNVLGKALTLRSEAGAAATVVFLEGETRIVLLDGNSTIRGFTITGGRARVGAGIRVTNGAQPRIEENVITGNVAARDGASFPAFGAGIAVEALARPVITRNTIHGNEAQGDGQGLLAYGGGIDVADDSSAEITNNVLEGNRASDSGGAISLGVSGLAASPSLTNNTIVGNEAGNGTPNTFSFGGGVLIADGAVPVLRNNLVIENGAGLGGGGFYFFGGGLQGIVYERNDFDGNLPDACAGLPASKCNGGQLFLPALFEDPANGRYRLRSDSPVIDQGTSSGVPATDADGHPRSVDGTLDGVAAPDIGAFEQQRESTRFRFEGRDLMAWDGSTNPAVTFELYRDPLATLGPGPLGSCLRSGLPSPSATDGAIPPSGGGFFYLVRGRGSVPGSLGGGAGGSERTAMNGCP